MRVKIIRWTDPTSSMVTLRVQRWSSGQWETVGDDWPLSQSEQANEFAMKLSMSKRDPIEMAVFEDGRKLEPVSLEERAEIMRQLADNAALTSYPRGLVGESSEKQS